jgi:uncharacterized protein (UPF0333 family)
MKKVQSGFAGIELVLVLVLVAVIGFAGVTAYNANKSAQENSSVSSDVKAPSVPQITSATDLDAAATMLDSTNVEANMADDANLDTELSEF